VGDDGAFQVMVGRPARFRRQAVEHALKPLLPGVNMKGCSWSTASSSQTVASTVGTSVGVSRLAGVTAPPVVTPGLSPHFSSRHCTHPLFRLLQVVVDYYHP